MERWVPWWEKTQPGAPPTTEERYRVGEWTLHASIGEAGPSYYSIRSDHRARPTGSSVTWQPHDGWVTYAGSVMFSTHESPLACLRWWVAQQ